VMREREGVRDWAWAKDEDFIAVDG
jgi:hypothetical protein